MTRITWVEILIVMLTGAAIAVCYTLAWVYCAHMVALAICLGLMVTFFLVCSCGVCLGMYIARGN